MCVEREIAIDDGEGMETETMEREHGEGGRVEWQGGEREGDGEREGEP